MEAILVLTGVGFLLLLTEMLLPGGVLGVIGGLLLTAAIVLGYVRFGALAGSGLLCAILVCVLVGFCVGMAVFPRTPFGRGVTLGSSVSNGDELESSASLVGSEGVTLSPLRPAGKALIAGSRLDVVAQGDFIEAGVPVVVIAGEGVRIVVSKKA